MSGEIIEGVTGRRPFPDAEQFAAQLGTWGISPSTQVVTYDNEGGLMAASRLWLMLRWLGHDAVAVLDGGYQAWLTAGAACPRRCQPLRRASTRPNCDQNLSPT